MASNAPAPGAKDGPLSSFDRVSKIVYLYRPKPDRNSSGASASPKLIILGGWMDAREAHLAKYTAKLQALYPDSPIVLVRSFVYHFTSPRFSGEIEPAAPLIRSIVADSDGNADGGRTPEMLIHVFSNGGSTMLRFLYDIYASSARPGESRALPPHVTVFDSSPGRFSWSGSVTAFSIPLARRNIVIRLLWKVFIHCLCATYWIFNVPWGRPGFLGRSWLAHNEREKNQAEIRRSYVYSEEDRLIRYQDVEEHAAAGRERGYNTKLEKFTGTAHVAHARVDELRYWSIVKDTWECRDTE